MTASLNLYEFVARGQLTEQALDSAGRKTRRLSEFAEANVAKILALDLLDDQLVENARAMSSVYVAIAAFENSVRQLISGVLLEQVGETWWDSCVSEKIRDRARLKRDDEAKVRWHVQRGDDPIKYTQMPDLVSVLRQNWTRFEPYIPSLEWAAGVMDTIERSRNVIMHSGSLSRVDVERVGMNIRDWVKQVGA